MKKYKTKSLLSWQGILAVIGIDWGDSGKGRLIDDLSSRAQVVARYNGGSNTGHTVKNEKGEFALHIMPSGIFNKNAICLIGRNVAVDLESLVSEMDVLNIAKVSYSKLVIDEQASLTMPWHKKLDGYRESQREKIGQKIDTTGKGVGPTYADRTGRIGLLVKDLFSSDFKDKLENEIESHNKHFDLNLDAKFIFNQYSQYAKRIQKYTGPTVPILKNAHKKGQNILFEGAQGVFLDIDSGTYPFVTSSNPGVVGIMRCFDIHPSKINEVIGITKAYMTRVGQGPMPTLIEGVSAETITKVGKEKGTTTGRIRRPGWLDLVLIKESIDVNGITSLAITKLDVLSHLKKIKVCITYSGNSQKTDYLGHDAEYLSKVEPIYKEFEGWGEDVTGARNFEELPLNAQKYINFIEDKAAVPVKFISVGPKRGQAIYK